MNDVRFAFRQLLRNPGFTAVAVLTLALGIGANTSMFSMLNVAMFPHMPYPDSGRLVRVYRTSPQSQTWSHSCANFLNHREQNHVTCCLVAVFAFGTAPAWLAARVDVNQRLKENVRGATCSRSQRRFQHFLIIGEVALALMLLAGTGTTIRLLQRFARLDPGWNADDLLTAEVSVPKSKYP